MTLILPTNSIKDTGFNVANSVRLFSNTFLNKTPTGNSNKQVFTFSTWLKRGNLGAEMGIFTAGNDSNRNGFFTVMFADDDALNIQFYDGAFDDLKTNRVFRDVSAWYHIVVAVDSTDGTDSNRIKIYVNGVQETSFSSSDYPNQNQNFDINEDANDVYVGVRRNTGGSPAGYYDGYIAEAVLIDGSQLAADQFGEFDEDSGIWKPIDVSGLTFGTNGFYLDFENSGSLGADVSGNGNNFTVNNLTSIDQSTDTCTNNYATFNPLGKANLTYAEGNTKITNSSGAHNGSLSTLAVNKGKWYYEVKFIDGSQTRSMAGICKVTDNLDNEYVGDTANSYGYFRANGNKFNNSSSSSYGTTPSNNSIISVAFDGDNGTLWFGLNGTWQNSATKSEIEAGTTTNSAFSSITMDDYFAFACSGEDATCQANFGSPSYAISSGNTDGNGYGNFEYEVPSGYYALNTKNLAEYG